MVELKPLFCTALHVPVSSVAVDKCWAFDRINFSNNIFLKFIPYVRIRQMNACTHRSEHRPTDHPNQAGYNVRRRNCHPQRLYGSICAAHDAAVDMVILMRANMNYNYYSKMINISFRAIRCIDDDRRPKDWLNTLECRSNYCAQIFTY